MKIAILTDVHSNFHSLKAVLEDIEAEKPDFVVGAGDMVGCSAYCGSADVWNTLRSQKIPFVLGNHEERLLRFYDPAADPSLRRSIQFMPLHYLSRQFSAHDIQSMQTLPLSITLEGPQGNDVLVCHASPGSLNKSPMQGIDAQMEQELQAVKAQVIVVGHLHAAWHQYWQEKLLIMAGSAGLPLRGKLDEVDYLVLTYHSGAWQFAYKTVKYDYRAALKEVIESDFLEQSGPIGWLMFDEALTQEDHLVPFLREYCSKKEPVSMGDWKKLVIGYFEHIKRWDAMRPYLQHLL